MIAAAVFPLDAGHGPHLGGLAYRPVLCARCGNRPGHPLARACTSTDCALRANDDHPLVHNGAASTKSERASPENFRKVFGNAAC